jgi:hypothetical protein
VHPASLQLCPASGRRWPATTAHREYAARRKTHSRPRSHFEPTSIPPKARVRQPGPQHPLQANGSCRPMTADRAECVPGGRSQSHKVTLAEDGGRTSRPSLQSRDHDRCRRRVWPSTAPALSFPLGPWIRRCLFCRALPNPKLARFRNVIQVLWRRWMPFVLSITFSRFCEHARQNGAVELIFTSHPPIDLMNNPRSFVNRSSTLGNPLSTLVGGDGPLVGCPVRPAKRSARARPQRAVRNKRF